MMRTRSSLMSLKGVAIGLAGSLAFILSHTASADPSTWPDAYDHWKQDLNNEGVQYSLGYRSEDLSAVSGGTTDAGIHAGQVALSSKFDMEHLVGWSGASITASFSLRDGDNINNASGVDALFGPQEIYGRGHYFRMSQFWLDQNLFGDLISVRIGRLNPGEDFQATECSFMNLSFCANQAGNFVADYWYNWPISQWGTAVKFSLPAKAYFKVGAYQVNPRNLDAGFLDVLAVQGGKGALLPAEIGWLPVSADGRITEFKIGGWYSTAPRADVDEDVNGAPAALTGQPFLQRSGAYGMFTSLVQQLTRGDRSSEKSGLRLVLKGSVADHQTSNVDRTIVGTLVYTGTFPSRTSDDVGLGLAFNHLNSRYSEYLSESAPSALAPSGNERTLEAYYSLRIGRYFMFRPDAQWIHHPGASSQREDVWVLGVRTEITI